MVVEKEEEFKEEHQGLIWGEVVGRRGGDEKLAKESLAKGDVVAFRHPKDPSKIRYKIEQLKYSSTTRKTEKHGLNHSADATDPEDTSGKTNVWFGHGYQ